MVRLRAQYLLVLGLINFAELLIDVFLIVHPCTDRRLSLCYVSCRELGAKTRSTTEPALSQPPCRWRDA